jgi:hypothetical protein
MTLSVLAGRAIVWLADSTPSPPPADPRDVTPGVIGFLATLFIAVATILLLIDMTRRIRRVRYREEIREILEGETSETEPSETETSETKPPEPRPPAED